jgi:two-component system response regulator
MNNRNLPMNIALADDDPDDCLLVREAFDHCGIEAKLTSVENGEELLAYLRAEGKYADEIEWPRPNAVLLDLNMPKKDGREALKEIKEDIVLRHVPVIIFTTSHADDDVLQTYKFGANSFLTKPSSFDDLVSIVKKFGEFWLDTAELPRV